MISIQLYLASNKFESNLIDNNSDCLLCLTQLLAHYSHPPQLKSSLFSSISLLASTNAHSLSLFLMSNDLLLHQCLALFLALETPLQRGPLSPSQPAMTTANYATTWNNNWCIRDGCNISSKGGGIRRGKYRSHRSRRHGYGMGGSSIYSCLLYTSPSPRDLSTSRMPSSA